jgi:hypothetical protein
MEDNVVSLQKFKDTKLLSLEVKHLKELGNICSDLSDKFSRYEVDVSEIAALIFLMDAYVITSMLLSGSSLEDIQIKIRELLSLYKKLESRDEDRV